MVLTYISMVSELEHPFLFTARAVKGYDWSLFRLLQHTEKNLLGWTNTVGGLFLSWVGQPWLSPNYLELQLLKSPRCKDEWCEGCPAVF